MQLSDMVAIAAMVLALVAGTGLVLVYRRLQRYQRNQRIIMGSRGSVDIVEHVSAVDDKLTNLRLAVEDLSLAARDHDVRIDNTLARVGIVRFDAYHDLGGRQSTAVALLNSMGDGVVMTTVVSRDFARMYVKLIRGGEADIPLAPEETEAFDQARGSTPFTIRPRVESAQDDQTDEGEDMDLLAPDAPMATGLPGIRAMDERELARENRRRKRQGLPPIDGKVMPSARGWDEEETPSSSNWDDSQTPSSGSLAERYVQQRRQTLGQTGDFEEPPPDDDDDTHEYDEFNEL